MTPLGADRKPMNLSGAMSHKVTIIARDLPGDLGLNWASPWAGAVFHPQHTASPLEQQMQTNCFGFYWDLAHRDPSSGVKVYLMTEYRDDSNDDLQLWYKTLMRNYSLIPKSDLPLSVTLGLKYITLAMNPLLLLPWLKKQLDGKGVKFIRAEATSIEEAQKLTKDKLMVNASGLGAQKLAGDAAVRPVRGQTMFVKTDFSKLVMQEGSEYTYVIPIMGRAV